MAFFNFDKYQPAQQSPYAGGAGAQGRHNTVMRGMADLAAKNMLERKRLEAEQKHLDNTNWARGAGQGAMLGGVLSGGNPIATGIGALAGAAPGFIGGLNEKGGWKNPGAWAHALKQPFNSGAAMSDTFSGLAPAAMMIAMNRSMGGGESGGWSETDNAGGNVSSRTRGFEMDDELTPEEMEMYGFNNYRV